MNKGIILGLVALLATMAIASAALLDGFAHQFIVSIPEPSPSGQCVCSLDDHTGQVTCWGDNGCSQMGTVCGSQGIEYFAWCSMNRFGANWIGPVIF